MARLCGGLPDRRAAHSLEVTERQGTVDYLVYPIAFNYRHYLELAMKALVQAGRQLLDDQVDFADSHDLARLWRECRTILTRMEPAPELSDLDAVEEKILQLNTLDPDSMAFRYPVGSRKKGRPSLLPHHLQRFNVRHFAAQVEQVAGFLSAAGEEIAVSLDWKSEMEAQADW